MRTLRSMSIKWKQMLIIMLTSTVALLLACAIFVAYDVVRCSSVRPCPRSRISANPMMLVMGERKSCGAAGRDVGRAKPEINKPGAIVALGHSDKIRERPARRAARRNEHYVGLYLHQERRCVRDL